LGIDRVVRHSRRGVEVRVGGESILRRDRNLAFRSTVFPYRRTTLSTFIMSFLWRSSHLGHGDRLCFSGRNDDEKVGYESLRASISLGRYSIYLLHVLRWSNTYI